MPNNLSTRSRELLDAYKIDDAGLNPEVLRGILDEYAQAFEAGEKSSLGLWGQLVATWVKSDTEAWFKPTRLGEYLQAIDQVSIKTIMGEGNAGDVFYQDDRGHTRTKKPVYDALNTLSHSLLGKGSVSTANPMLKALVDAGQWNPHNLLSKLHPVIEAQYDYMELYYGDTVHFRLTAQASWLELAGPLLVETAWSPPAHEVYNQLWELRMIPSLDSKPAQQKNYEDYAQAILRKIPGQAVGGLASITRLMYCTKPWSEDVWNAFFPLPIATTPSVALLQSTIQLVQAAREHGVDKAEALLRKYHPQLHALIDVHLGMFGTAEFGEPINVSHLVEMFEAQKAGILPDTSIALPLDLVN